MPLLIVYTEHAGLHPVRGKPGLDNQIARQLASQRWRIGLVALFLGGGAATVSDDGYHQGSCGSIESARLYNCQRFV